MRDCRYGEELQDLFDGVLPPERESEVAAHLESCDVCAAAWDELVALRAAAADLPSGLAPDRDLWPDIAARMAAGEAAPGTGTVATRPAAARPWHPGRARWLAAAAVLALAVLSGLQLRDIGRDDPYDALGMGYAAVREDCRAGLEESASEMPAESVTAVDEGLDLIDQAIRETRNALDKVAAAPEQAGRLVAGYHKKMDLLQKLARLASQ